MVLYPKSSYSIRLIRMGCKNRPFYQLGAIPTRRRPNLLPDEVVGNVDPIPNQFNEIVVSADLKRLSFWMGKGARFSQGAENVLGMAGWLPIPPQVYIHALENREKEREPEVKTDSKQDSEEEFVIESVISKKKIC